MTSVSQDRWKCKHCGASGWWTPSTHIGKPPEQEHDRPDRVAQRCKLAGLTDDQIYALAIANGMPPSGRHG